MDLKVFLGSSSGATEGLLCLIYMMCILYIYKLLVEANA